MNSPRIALYVLDTGPLITLAAADSLDFLLYPNVPVVIPDPVFYEATRDTAKLGAQSIIDWVKQHHSRVEIAVTNTYLNFDAARKVNPRAYAPKSWRTGRCRGHRRAGEITRGRQSHLPAPGELPARPEGAGMFAMAANQAHRGNLRG
jgi:hypothetical protein